MVTEFPDNLVIVTLEVVIHKGYRPVNSETPSWGGGGSIRALKHVTLSKISTISDQEFDMLQEFEIPDFLS